MEEITINDDSPSPYKELFRAAVASFQGRWPADAPNVNLSVAKMVIRSDQSYELLSPKGISRTTGRVADLLPLDG
jgi:hypothetical protein